MLESAAAARAFSPTRTGSHALSARVVEELGRDLEVARGAPGLLEGEPRAVGRVLARRPPLGPVSGRLT